MTAKEYYKSTRMVETRNWTLEMTLNFAEEYAEALRKHAVSGSLPTDEESRYRIDLINELINIYEHPEDSNKEWKDAIIGVAREKGYGNYR